MFNDKRNYLIVIIFSDGFAYFSAEQRNKMLSQKSYIQYGNKVDLIR